MRAHSTFSPRKITAKAKTAAIKLDVRLRLRSARRGPSSEEEEESRREVTTSTPTSTNDAGPSVNTNAETLLKALGAEIWLGNAIELLHGERARVHSIMRG